MQRRRTCGSSLLEALGTIASYRHDTSHAGCSRHVARTAGGSRLTATLMVLIVAVAAEQVWESERWSAALLDEVAGLHAQLGDKRELIARQRHEMAQVASAVDRLASTFAALGKRGAEARRLAHLEASGTEKPALVNVAASSDGGTSLVSEDARRALEELASLDGQVAAAGDSFAVLTALLKDGVAEVSRSVPTLWPVRGLVTSPFGARTSPYGEGLEMHPGIDIAAPDGRPVTAAGSGKVIFAGSDPGYGGLVIVDHGGQLDTLYAHLSELYVGEGQRVRGGQAIGAVGATGRATGAHLHYEVRVNGAPVDPRHYLAK
jgi:murein DD-endopeptidase MepM/ murein hydrolase activator NlpD